MPERLMQGQQKSSPDKSDELLIFCVDILSCGSDLSVRRGGWNWHLFFHFQHGTE